MHDSWVLTRIRAVTCSVYNDFSYGREKQICIISIEKQNVASNIEYNTVTYSNINKSDYTRLCDYYQFRWKCFLWEKYSVPKTNHCSSQLCKVESIKPTLHSRTSIFHPTSIWFLISFLCLFNRKVNPIVVANGVITGVLAIVQCAVFVIVYCPVHWSIFYYLLYFYCSYSSLC